MLWNASIFAIWFSFDQPCNISTYLSWGDIHQCQGRREWVLFQNSNQKSQEKFFFYVEFASVSSLHNKDFFLVFCKNLIRLMFSVLTIYTAAVIIVALLLKQKGKF